MTIANVAKIAKKAWEFLTPSPNPLYGREDIQTKEDFDKWVKQPGNEEAFANFLRDQVPDAGGILKPHAIGQYFGRLGKIMSDSTFGRGPQYDISWMRRKGAETFKAMAETPAKEYRSLRDLYPKVSKKSLGEYDPTKASIMLDPTGHKIEGTFHHEMAHSRTNYPTSKKDVYIWGGQYKSEPELTSTAEAIRQDLWEYLSRRDMQDKFWNLDPTEAIAVNFESKITKLGKEKGSSEVYDSIFREVLQDESQRLGLYKSSLNWLDEYVDLYSNIDLRRYFGTE